MSSGVNQNVVRQLKAKVEKELMEKERECIQYWRKEFESILNRRHQDLAALQNDIRRVLNKMNTRLGQL